MALEAEGRRKERQEDKTRMNLKGKCLENRKERRKGKKKLGGVKRHGEN